MWDLRTLFYLFSTILLLCALTSAQRVSETTSDPHASVITYYSPITTFPVTSGPSPLPHLDLRAAPAAAPAAAAAAPAAAQPAAQPAAAQPAAAPAAAAPVAGAAPAAGVGGAGAVPAAAQPATNPGQVPSITTFYQQTVVNGVSKQVAIVYTQKFSSVPSEGPTPKQGEIGLGTLTGKVGVVRTAEAKKGAASKEGQAAIGTIALGALFTIVGSLLMWA
ncbi:MAG: hypothetical protein Q9191_001641 [Dirinaria sp. TL-2023a]